MQLNDYLTVNEILYKHQFGFRPKLSTDMAVHTLTDYIYTAFDESKFAIGVFLDLSKAFDTLNRKILLKKLNYYGIDDIENKWFESYLSNRQQVTKVGDQISDLKTNDTGVAQGSTLS